MNTQRAFYALFAALIVGAAPTASAVVYDLESSPTILVDTAEGPIFFSTDFTKTTGTGVLDPFLSIQGAGGAESGFNIDLGVLDTKRNGQFTRTQRVSALQTVTVNGIDYYSFLIDINEPNNIRSLVSLDTLKIYTSPTLYTSLADLDGLATLQLDMDSLAQNSLLYDDANSGSGEGDIAFLIPTWVLADALSTDFFYMYQQFGNVPGYGSDSGFEETRHAGDVTFVPIPETKALMPILAVLGVVVAGPFVRRCFHP